MSGHVRRPATGSSPTIAERLRAPTRHGAEPRQVWIATLTVILCLAALVTLTLVRAKIAERVKSPLSAKLADADRVLYYLVERDSGPMFRIGASDHSLKLITHLLLPDTAPYIPDQEYAYGIIVIVRDLDGRELSRHEVNIRTRQSKSGGGRFGWRFENSFMLDDDRQVTDDRLTRVRLPQSNRDRLIELRLVPRVPGLEVTGLARIYTRQPRPVDQRSLQELSLSPGIGRELVDHLTDRDWNQLSEDERRVKLSQVWKRLAAEGDANHDYQTLSIYETGFRAPRRTKTNSRRLEVERWRSLAINVLGPAELELRVLGDSRAASALEIHRRGLDGTEFAYPRHGAHDRPLTIPAGVHTLFIESERFVELELGVVDSEAERVWVIEGDRRAHEDEDGNEVLEPDRRKIEVVRVGAQWPEPPRWKVAGPKDATSRIFRFDVRVAAHFASSWWRDVGPTPSVELCFFDAEDNELGCDDWVGQPSIASRFENLREGGRRTSNDPEPSPARWYVVSESQTLRVIAPPETATVELRDPAGGLDQRLLVRGYGFWPEVDTVLGEPFQSYESTQVQWRYPPLQSRTWFPLRPSNYDALQDSLAVTELHAQVRLQPSTYASDRARVAVARRWWTGDPDLDDGRSNALTGADGWDPGPWVTLVPRGVHRRRSILERLDDDAVRRLARRWDSSLFTRIWPDRKLITNLAATGPRAPELHWRVEPRLLGRLVTLTIDGEPYTHKITATRGRWRLPVTNGKRRRITLDFDGPRGSFAMWLDRPVVFGSPPISRRRAIHELRREIGFPLIKRGTEAVTVNVVVYLPRQRDRADLTIEVDGGDPERRSGIVGDTVSLATHHYTVDRSAAYDERGRVVDARMPIRFADLDRHEGQPLDTVTITLTLGEDIAAGRHYVRVKLNDGGWVWVRAFHRGVAVRRAAAGSWTEAAAPGEDQ